MRSNDVRPCFFTYVFVGLMGRGPSARDRTTWLPRRHAVPAASKASEEVRPTKRRLLVQGQMAGHLVDEVVASGADRECAGSAGFELGVAGVADDGVGESLPLGPVRELEQL